MGRIQTDIGLITGIPIADTVKKLMAINARPRDLLVERNTLLKQRQTAVTELAALLASVQYVAKNLGKDDLYQQRTATTSNASALTATVTGNPTPGVYSVIPLRAVQSHILAGSGVASSTAPIGGGTASIRFGDDLERPVGLNLLGSGQGFARGIIRITDRSGATAEIDLSAAQSIDDVLTAINNNGSIDVSASLVGDAVRLTDHTSQTVSNLKVQEVGNGRTAASLGLAGIDASASVADGQDMLLLYDAIGLDALNDGRGIRVSTVLSDIQYTLRDGTTGSIDLSPIIPGGSQIDREITLGQVLDRLNAAAPGKLAFAIAADGKRLAATDLTAGSETFTLSSVNGSAALADLGLDTASGGATITGRRILGGAKSVLLSGFNGGSGLGSLGLISLTDRSGASAVVDLSNAETVADVINAFNSAGIGITARTNFARTAIELVDTTGQTTSPMIVASADGLQTAEKLNLAVNDAVTYKSSGDLHFQTVAHNTRLADFNGGGGVARGTLAIQDTTGKRAVLNLNQAEIETVGDVLSAINSLNLAVLAEINPTGDGIRLVDTAHGAFSLAVTEGASTSAKDLHLLGGTQTVDVGGQPTQVVDGSTTYSITLDATDALTHLRDKINALDAGVTASIFNDGSGLPYRLALASNRSGRRGHVVFDLAGPALTFQETSPARDALLVFGGSDASSGILAASSSNSFADVVPGVVLDLKQASSTPVQVTISTVATNLVVSMKAMVDNYNKFRSRLTELTEVDASGKSGLLTGDSAALRMDVELSEVFSSRILVGGTPRSLATIGLAVGSDGTLSLDETTFKAAYDQDPAQVRAILNSGETSLSARLNTAIEQLAGADRSLITERLKALDGKITANEARIESMNKILQRRQERLLRQFYSLETAIAKINNSLNALTTLQTLASPNNRTQTSNSR